MENKMPIPTDRKYLQTHEWHKLDGDTVSGISLSQFPHVIKSGALDARIGRPASH